MHLVQSNLACRGLAAKWEVTPPYCYDSPFLIRMYIRLENESLTGPLNHLPYLAGLGVVAAGEYKEIIAADKPLGTVANRWETLGSDVASNSFLVYFEIRCDLRDRELFC